VGEEAAAVGDGSEGIRVRGGLGWGSGWWEGVLAKMPRGYLKKQHHLSFEEK
jgi:hypothetical protein